MIRERAKELWPIMKAYSEGECIQYLKKDGTWEVSSEEESFSHGWHYRIKPEPKLRPWKYEEVPVGALIRNKNWDFKNRVMIIGARFDGVSIPWSEGCDVTRIVPFNDLSDYEHSTNGGKSWLPCGVEVEES